MFSSDATDDIFDDKEPSILPQKIPQDSSGEIGCGIRSEMEDIHAYSEERPFGKKVALRNMGEDYGKKMSADGGLRMSRRTTDGSPEEHEIDFDMI